MKSRKMFYFVLPRFRVFVIVFCIIIVIFAIKMYSYFQRLPAKSQQLNRFIHGKNLGENLIVVKPLQLDGTGAARGHAQATSFAQNRVDLRLARKRSFLDERRC